MHGGEAAVIKNIVILPDRFREQLKFPRLLLLFCAAVERLSRDTDETQAEIAGRENLSLSAVDKSNAVGRDSS